MKLQKCKKHIFLQDVRIYSSLKDIKRKQMMKSNIKFDNANKLRRKIIIN